MVNLAFMQIKYRVISIQREKIGIIERMSAVLSCGIVCSFFSLKRWESKYRTSQYIVLLKTERIIRFLKYVLSAKKFGVKWDIKEKTISSLVPMAIVVINA